MENNVIKELKEEIYQLEKELQAKKHMLLQAQETIEEDKIPIRLQIKDEEILVAVGQEEENYLMLPTDDGREIECLFLMTFGINGEDYMAVIPYDRFLERTTGNVMLYQYEGDEEHQIKIFSIDEKKWEEVKNCFENLLVEV